MKTWKVIYTGRNYGALGVFYNMECLVEVPEDYGYSDVIAQFWKIVRTEVNHIRSARPI